MSLLYISQQLTIYCGLFFFVTGIFGNGMNIFIFSSIHTYRKTPSSFYFLMASIINTLYILISLPFRIVSVGYGNDSPSISIIWCKMYQFLIGVLSLISFTCCCLATIDQFFVTSRNARLRRCSNIKWSHRIVFIVIIICCLYGIPALLYADIVPPMNTCSYDNSIYYQYSLMYVLIFLCIIPVLIMSVFGCLTYRNIRQTIVLVGQHADRQLVRMTLTHIVLVLISVVPFGIYDTYIVITSGIVKNYDRRMIEALVGAIVGVIFYFYYVVCLILLSNYFI